MQKGKKKNKKESDENMKYYTKNINIGLETTNI